MTIPEEYSFTRYLSAKKSVDDRALNRLVWNALAGRLNQMGRAKSPLSVLEIGGGIGTMVERMLEWDALPSADYTLIDALDENIAEARRRLSAWGQRKGYRVDHREGALLLERGEQRLRLYTEEVDLFDFMHRAVGQRAWDVLIANAFLDLVDIPSTLPVLLELLEPGGLFYFSINFDGLTALEPEIDADLDTLIYRLYHATMDARQTDGKPSGDSRAGRHLFAHLNAAGGRVLQAGASDWVVHAGEPGYPGDEGYFLHFIIHTIETALRGHPQLDPKRFAQWIAQRHDQIEDGDLVYIAHQLDFAGTRG